MAIDLLEYRVLSVIRDRLYYLKYLNIIRKDLFESRQTRFIYDLIGNYHEKHKGDKLTIRSLRILLYSSLKPDQKSDYRGIVARIRKGDIKEPSVIEDIVKRWVKKQLLKHTIDAAITSLESGEEADYERIRQRIDEAIAVDSNSKMEESYDYFRDPHKRIHDESRESRIATRISQTLDNALGGGLAAGELAIIIAPTGVGKTLSLVNIGVGAMQQGKKVIHATLEISPRKAARRYDVRLTGASFKDIAEDPNLVKRKLERLRLIGAGLQIKDYTSSLCSTSDLRAYLERIHPKFRFDLLIIDHADLMYSSRQFKEKRHELSSIVAGLRRLGAEFGVPVWTASQATRQAGEKGHTRLWDIAEDIGKANWADLAITISQTEGEKDEGIAWLKIAKTRLDKGNPRIQVMIDYDTMSMKGTKE